MAEGDVIEYFCTLHPYMTSVLTITAAGAGNTTGGGASAGPTINILEGSSVQGSDDYDPDPLTAKVGDEVKVVNQDTVPIPFLQGQVKRRNKGHVLSNHFIIGEEQSYPCVRRPGVSNFCTATVMTGKITASDVFSASPFLFHPAVLLACSHGRVRQRSGSAHCRLGRFSPQGCSRIRFIIEYIHRSVAATTGMLTIATMAVVLRSKAAPKGMKIASIVAGAAVIGQITLGAIVIVERLHAILVTAHLGLGIVLFSMVLITAIYAHRIEGDKTVAAKAQ